MGMFYSKNFKNASSLRNGMVRMPFPQTKTFFPPIFFMAFAIYSGLHWVNIGNKRKTMETIPQSP